MTATVSGKMLCVNFDATQSQPKFFDGHLTAGRAWRTVAGQLDTENDMTATYRVSRLSQGRAARASWRIVPGSRHHPAGVEVELVLPGLTREAPGFVLRWHQSARGAVIDPMGRLHTNAVIDPVMAARREAERRASEAGCSLLWPEDEGVIVSDEEVAA